MTDRTLLLLGTTLLLALVALTALALPVWLDRHSEPLVTVIHTQTDADTVPDLEAVRYAALPLVSDRRCR